MHDVPALVKSVSVYEHGGERISEVDRSQPDGLPVGGGTGRELHREPLLSARGRKDEGRGLPKNPAFGGFRPEDPPGGLGAPRAVVFADAVQNRHVDGVFAPGCAGTHFAREGSESTHFVSPSKKKGTQRRTAPTFGAGDLR